MLAKLVIKINRMQLVGYFTSSLFTFLLFIVIYFFSFIFYFYFYDFYLPLAAHLSAWRLVAVFLRYLREK